MTTDSPALFRFAVSQGPNVLVQGNAIYNRLLCDIFTEDVGNMFLSLAGMSQVLQERYCTTRSVTEASRPEVTADSC